MEFTNVSEQDRGCEGDDDRGLPCLEHATIALTIGYECNIDLCDKHYLQLKVLLQNH